ncbi:MAG: hypothetical protein GEU73_02060 [Chloroflexi bacterium]|nr:hypothetical protein [Chloroflexota bacterium]
MAHVFRFVSASRARRLLTAAAVVVLLAATQVYRLIPAEASQSSLHALQTDRPLRMAYYFPLDRASFDSLRENVQRLDVVAPHWLTMSGDGRVRSSEVGDVVAFLRSSEVVVLPSVALENHDAAHPVLGDPALSAIAMDELVAAASQWDGLALDFEGVDPADRDALTAFIRTLGDRLRASGKVFAIALPAKNGDMVTGWSGAYDYAAISGAADLYLIMAYGYRTSASSIPGSTSPLSWVDQVMAFAATQLPVDRVILGVAFYGYDWNLAQGPPARALRYVDTGEVLATTGATAQFDPEVGSATFSYERDGEAHDVWFEDDRSVGAKLDLVAKYGLRGAGAWRLGQEHPGTWRLWDDLLSQKVAGAADCAPIQGASLVAVGPIVVAFLATLSGTLKR